MIRDLASVCADPDCSHTYLSHTWGPRCSVTDCGCRKFKFLNQPDEMDEVVSAACLVWRHGQQVPQLDIRTRIAYDTLMAHVTQGFTREQREHVKRYTQRILGPNRRLS